MRFVPITLVSLSFAVTALAQNQWSPMNGVFDNYPTERAAVDGIVDEFVSRLRTTKAFDEPDWNVVVAKLSPQQSGLPPLPDGNVGVAGSGGVNGESFEFSPNLTNLAADNAVNEAVARLHRKLPRATITTGDFPDAAEQNQAVIGIGVGEIEFIDKSAPYCSRGYIGRMHSHILFGNSTLLYDVRFTNRTWADDFDAFLTGQPSQNWIVGRSLGAYTNQEQAFRSACDDAAQQFARAVSERGRIAQTHLNLGNVRNLAWAQFHSRWFADKFVQESRTPGVDHWRVAVLVSSDDATMDRIVPQQNFSGNAVTERVSYSPGNYVKPVIVMVLVIVGLYLFLRGATRGFFSQGKHGRAQ
jgi:hypothetical protein